MGITERLANLPTWAVIITVIVLFGIRQFLLKQKAGWAKSVAEIAESLAVAMALVFLIIRPFIVQAFFIPSESMVPTLKISDHILVNKFIYRFTEPKNGDIIVFKAPKEADSSGQEKDFIKRVIGTPGDIIRFTPGYVIAGGQQYTRQEIRSALMDFSSPDEPLRVKLVENGALVDGRLVTKSELAAALGVPPDKIKIVPGKVYRNGKVIDEPYIAEDAEKPYPNDLTNPEWVVIDKNGEKSR